jgi:hypothetical protein
VIDDPLSLLSLGIWLFAAGMWPIGFLFGACSVCCDECPWFLNYNRCLKISIVDSSPAAGGDVRVRLDDMISLGGLQGVGAGSSPAGLGPIEVYQVASEIQVSVQLSLSASGASRTPVGETRTQVWRFNRSAPTSPPATAYDVLGPGWHLQVDLSVSGVASEEDAGVSSSLGTDDFGQPKLILQVNQWTDNITHDEVVTLFPVGLQRWAGFRLTESTATATRVSGDNYTGWTVSKLSGLTTQQQRYAVRVVNAAQGSSSGLPAFLLLGSFAERVFLDDQVALDFLNGDTSIQVPATLTVTRNCLLQILPDNVLCGIPENRLGVGIPLGIYPEFCTLALTSAYPTACDSVVAMRPAFFEGCATTWQSTYLRRTASSFGITAGPSDFYAGRTLLWNLEQGPYRTSFLKDFVFPISLGGDGAFSVYDLPRLPCPSGTSVQNGDMCVSTPHTALISWEVDIEVVDGISYTGNDCESAILSVDYTTKIVTFSGSRVASYTPGISFSNDHWFSGFLSGRPLGETAGVPVTGGAITIIVGGVPQNCGSVFADLRDFRVSANASGNAGVCSSGQLLQKNNSQALIEEGQPLPLFTLTPPPVVTRPRTLADPPLTGPFGNPLPVVMGQLAPISGNVEIDLLDSPSWSEPPRVSCTNWSPDNIPPEGGTITRTCSNAGYPLSLTVGQSNTRLPRLYNSENYLGTENILRAGKCNLIGLRRTGTAGTGATIFLSAVAEQCYYFSPAFGGTINVSGPGDIPLCGDGDFLERVPCDGCTLSVELVSGQEFGRVRYITEGEKAGLVELVAITTWFGGEGVTVTSTCGSDTITQEIVRPALVPTAPLNLSVSRNPCSTATLEWEAPESDGNVPIAAYNIEFRPVGETAWTAFGTVTPPALTATITGLVRIGYEFRVSATNSIGTGPFSNVAVNGFELAAPTNLTFMHEPPCTSVQLSWTPPPTAECVAVANYILQFREFGITEWTSAGTVDGDAVTGIATGLTAGTRYQFRVGSVDDVGVERFTDLVTSGQPPPVPTGIAAAISATPGEIDVTWNFVDLQPCFPAQFVVRYFAFLGNELIIPATELPPVSTTFFALTGVQPGVEYFFRVRAVNSVGTSDFSSLTFVVVPSP